MLYLVILLFFFGLVLLWQAWRLRKATGLPAGRIIYADTRNWQAVEEPLYDPGSGLTGRPDYLVQQAEQLIPVEVKSSRVSEAPYDGHIFQLAAYCLLVERVYKKRPAYGILHYPNRTYRIDYTQQLEGELLALLSEMRVQERRKEVARSHANPARCRGCGYRAVCDQRIDTT